MENESMEYDVIIVGAGPAGLAAAIKLKQLAQEANKIISVCLLEKGAQIGAHLLSGAVLEPKSLQALLPNEWQNAPLNTPVSSDEFYLLTKQWKIKLPLPKLMKNEGNYIISLGELCRYLAEQAEHLGCEIYAGFAASNILYNNIGQVIGVATGAFGLDKQGNKTTNYQPGMLLYAKQTLFAEGCRGELSQTLIKRFNLKRKGKQQTYGLGIKELWHIKPDQHQLGKVTHTIGWPLDQQTYGGSFIYHLSDNRLAIGLVIGLDYQNCWLNPFAEMQRLKTHPFIRPLLTGGERIGFGARAICEGGWQGLPKLTFPGGALLGDAAGFVNVPKIKGIHTAIQSGMLAAEACFIALQQTFFSAEIKTYNTKVKQSWLSKELYAVRNIRPGFKYGLWPGLINSFFEICITFGHSPWTLKNPVDYQSLKPAEKCKKIDYPAPDGLLTFDKLSSVYLSNTYHEHNQPCHLSLKDPSLAIEVNYNVYESPETRYCPAAVYEIVNENNNPRLQINAQNCIHCKTCDIKDPKQNIVWHSPEGGGGPNYNMM